MDAVTAERVHSAIDQSWTLEQETRYLASQSAREPVHIAFDAHREIIGLQTLDLWSPMLTSMSHAGQLGTFVLPQWRGKGIGRALWQTTEPFVRQAGFRKLVIQVRASNFAAQRFYSSLGFQQCGRLTRQVMIDGVEDDELLMELFL